MPHAIGHYAAEERIVRVCDPLGELGAALFVRRVVGQAEVRLHSLERGNARRGPRTDWLEHTTAVEHLRNAGVLRYNRVHLGCLWPLGEQGLNVLAHTGQLAGGLAAHFALLGR